MSTRRPWMRLIGRCRPKLPRRRRAHPAGVRMALTTAWPRLSRSISNPTIPFGAQIMTYGLRGGRVTRRSKMRCPIPGTHEFAHSTASPSVAGRISSGRKESGIGVVTTTADPMGGLPAFSRRNRIFPRVSELGSAMPSKGRNLRRRLPRPNGWEIQLQSRELS